MNIGRAYGIKKPETAAEREEWCRIAEEAQKLQQAAKMTMYDNVLADPKPAPSLIDHASIIASRLATIEGELLGIKNGLLGAGVNGGGIAEEAEYPRTYNDTSLYAQLEYSTRVLNRIDDIINQINNRLL